MKSSTYMPDRAGSSNVTRGVRTALFCAAVVLGAACGGGSKGGQTTTPTNKAKGSADQTSMTDTNPPDTAGGNPSGGGDAGGGGGGSNAGGTTGAADKPITFPNLDPDPAQAKAQVDQHLNVAKQALSAPTPDADTALREAKAALAIDAASIDAAAMVAFAYYHKKQYDTAELVLDDVFKRQAAKQNANIYYVYGLVYDHTNRPEQAVLAYKMAVQLNSSLQSAQVDLGVHQLQNKQYAEAQGAFEGLTRGGRNDAVTLTSLGSAYRGHSADYPPGSGDRNQLILQAEKAYKQAISVNPNYGPAYYNLGLLYLDGDPYPSGGGALDSVQRLNASKGFFDQYKNMPGVDMKLYDERMKDVTKALKRAQKKQKKGANP